MNGLRKIREVRGPAQKQPAQHLHTTDVVSVSRHDTQDQRLPLPLMRRLAKILECTVCEIAGEHEQHYGHFDSDLMGDIIKGVCDYCRKKESLSVEEAREHILDLYDQFARQAPTKRSGNLVEVVDSIIRYDVRQRNKQKTGKDYS